MVEIKDNINHDKGIVLAKENSTMKRITAIVRASKFEEVRQALHEHEINFFTFYEVKGYGHAHGNSLSYRGAVYDQGFIGRIKMEIILSDSFAEVARDTISEAAQTGEKGDGIITMEAIESVVNIRTKLIGEEAINK